MQFCTYVCTIHSIVPMHDLYLHDTQYCTDAWLIHRLSVRCKRLAKQEKVSRCQIKAVPNTVFVNIKRKRQTCSINTTKLGMLLIIYSSDEWSMPKSYQAPPFPFTFVSVTTSSIFFLQVSNNGKTSFKNRLVGLVIKDIATGEGGLGYDSWAGQIERCSQRLAIAAMILRCCVARPLVTRFDRKYNGDLTSFKSDKFRTSWSMTSL